MFPATTVARRSAPARVVPLERSKFGCACGDRANEDFAHLLDANA
jgi:hypothetical protein